MSVSRETPEGLALRLGLGDSAAKAIHRLLTALAGEPDPPTTVRDPALALDRHIADSLSALEIPDLARARRIADIGAGAGFPGLALAIALPEASVDLIESSGRKCEVIERLARVSGIPNAHAVPERAEDWAGRQGAGAYDAVTARAVGPLAVLAEYAAPLLSQGGVLVAWKGARDEQEEDSLRAAAAVLGLEPRPPRRTQPFPDARERHLHVLEKVAPTPERFPRRPGMARKRPIA